jgi:hypothetical protein
MPGQILYRNIYLQTAVLNARLLDIDLCRFRLEMRYGLVICSFLPAFEVVSDLRFLSASIRVVARMISPQAACGPVRLRAFSSEYNRRF